MAETFHHMPELVLTPYYTEEWDHEYDNIQNVNLHLKWTTKDGKWIFASTTIGNQWEYALLEFYDAFRELTDYQNDNITRIDKENFMFILKDVFKCDEDVIYHTKAEMEKKYLSHKVDKRPSKEPTPKIQAL